MPQLLWDPAGQQSLPEVVGLQASKLVCLLWYAAAHGLQRQALQWSSPLRMGADRRQLLGRGMTGLSPSDFEVDTLPMFFLDQSSC